MEFYRQEYWSELPFPSPGDLSDLGTEPRSPALQADSLPSELQGNFLCVCVRVWHWAAYGILIPQPGTEAGLRQ